MKTIKLYKNKNTNDFIFERHKKAHYLIEFWNDNKTEIFGYEVYDKQNKLIDEGEL